MSSVIYKSMYLGFWCDVSMPIRIIPTNSIMPILVYWLKCTCWCQSRVERSLIHERTKAGRAAAVARGVKLGHKPKLSPQQVTHARKLLDQGEDRRDIARLLKVSWRTVERALRNR